MRFFSPLALLAALLLSTAPVSAQEEQATVAAPYTFDLGFAALSDRLGDEMGQAASAEYAADDGSGYTLQITTTGLAYWQAGTPPTWTNGWRRVALVQQKLVTWEGTTLEPPAPVVAAVTSPYAYLYATYPSQAPALDLIIGCESRWDPNARNPSSGAAGYAQFLASTWATTPQGRQGLSVYNPIANIDGAAWLHKQQGATPWAASRGCHGLR